MRELRFLFSLAAVGLHCFMQAFSSSEEGALLSVVREGLLILSGGCSCRSMQAS